MLNYHGIDGVPNFHMNKAALTALLAWTIKDRTRRALAQVTFDVVNQVSRNN